MVSSLNPYQFAFNDFVFGAGTPYSIISVDGLSSLPPLRTQDDNRGYVDGSYSGRDFYDGRTVTMNIITFGDSSHSAQYYYRLLRASLVPQQDGTPGNLSTFQFRLDSGDTLKTMQGRVRSNETLIDADYTYGYIQSIFTFYFPDPRYYDNTVQTGSGSSILVANTGWATSCPTITIASPSATSFLIYNSVGTMSFANVDTSKNVVIDLLYCTITQNSVSARNILSGSSKWIYTPANSSGNYVITAGSMSMSWQNAYI